MHVFGARSLAELAGVHPDLVAVCHRALQLCPQDFAVHDGLRTAAEQAALVASGASRTHASQHLPQPDGYGHAVDLVPVINSKLRWEWPAIYPIASAVRKAATELGVRIRWGGCWAELTNTRQSPESMVEDYTAARRAAGQSAFTDGPHFELLAAGNIHSGGGPGPVPPTPPPKPK